MASKWSKQPKVAACIVKYKDFNSLSASDSYLAGGDFVFSRAAGACDTRATEAFNSYGPKQVGTTDEGELERKRAALSSRPLGPPGTVPLHPV